MFRARIQTFLLATLLLFSLHPANADDGADIAKESFQKASKLFADGQEEAALPHFEMAYEVSGHRGSATIGLAQCERALGHFSAALVHYREYIQRNPDGKNVERVKNTLGKLKKEHVRLLATRAKAASTTSAGKKWSKPTLWIVMDAKAAKSGAAVGVAMVDDQSKKK